MQVTSERRHQNGSWNPPLKGMAITTREGTTNSWTPVSNQSVKTSHMFEPQYTSILNFLTPLYFNNMKGLTTSAIEALIT